MFNQASADDIALQDLDESEDNIPMSRNLNILPQSVDPFNQFNSPKHNSSEEEPSFYEDQFNFNPSEGMFKESPEEVREELKEQIEVKVDNPFDKKAQGINFIARNKQMLAQK